MRACESCAIRPAVVLVVLAGASFVTCAGCADIAAGVGLLFPLDVPAPIPALTGGES